MMFMNSLINKLQIIAKGATHEDAVRKLTRALMETRIRGVKVNKPFVLNVLKHPDFLRGFVDTSFIDENPQLFSLRPTRGRSHKILKFIAETAVNGPTTQLATDLKPARIVAAVAPSSGAVPSGWRDVLKKNGPKGFAKAIRDHKGLLLTDTTFRDAHQSLLATRVRTFDLKRIAPQVSRTLPQLFSLENWGGWFTFVRSG